MWAIDKSVETTVASERLYRIGSKQLSSLSFIVENSYTIAMAFLPNIFTSLIVMNKILVALNLLIVTKEIFGWRFFGDPNGTK